MGGAFAQWAVTQRSGNRDVEVLAPSTPKLIQLRRKVALFVDQVIWPQIVPLAIRMAGGFDPVRIALATPRKS